MQQLRRRFACLFISLCACGDAGSAGTGETGTGETGAETTSAAATTGEPTSTGVTSSSEPGSSTSGGESDTGAAPADLPAALCEPDGGGPYWLLEGETVTVPLTCKTGLAPAEFTIDALPEGADYDPATATLTWTPGLDQAAVYHLTVTALGETADLKIGVADRWDDPANVPVVDPAIYTEEYGLPVLHLQPSPDISADGYTPATATYRGHTYTMEAKYRGAASLGYPKKSYTLKFTKADKFGEPELLGGVFTGKRKIVLISTFDDNAYVRQRLAYEMWDALDPAHIQIRAYSGVVFLDGAYYGLYTFADHVDGYLMEDHGMLQDGNLYKARTHDADFRLAGKSSPHEGLTKEEGVPADGEPGAYDDLDELVTFVATSEDAEFTAQIDDRILRREFEDWWIFVSLIMGDDSAGKNSYLYHDPGAGPWRFAPWDFNDSFGQTWQTARKGFDAEPESYKAANELFVRLLEIPTFGDPLRARYGEVLAGPWALDEILARLDAMLAETAPSARRDEARWADPYQSYGGWNWRDDFLDYEGEAAYLRAWIVDRWEFVADIY